MQEADEPARGGTGTQAAEPARTLSPIAAFLILLAIGAVALGAFLLTREDDAEPAARDRGPAFALTDEEAVERFKELDDLLTDAYRSRDLSVLSLILAPGSPIARTVVEEITDLKRRSIIPKPLFETRTVRILEKSDDQIVLQQVVVSDARFVTESGRDVTKPRTPELQTVNWTLQRVESKWLLFDSVIVDAEPIERGES
jgi:hypothetical protein